MIDIDPQSHSHCTEISMEEIGRDHSALAILIEPHLAGSFVNHLMET